MGRRNRHSIDAELELIRARLQALGQKEKDFQRVIDDLCKMKEDVVNERNTLETTKSELESEKEPINWLPPELLIHIFLSLSESNSPSSESRPALTISHTCAKWRNIALSTPRLWSRLVLHGYEKSESKIGRLYLERSKLAPLEVEYSSLPDISPTFECLQTANFLAKANSHFYRLESLSLQAGSAIALIYILPYLNDHANTFPHLRSLTLGITTPNPTFLEAPSFLDRESKAMKELKARGSSEKAAASSTSPLLHLKLEQVPLLSIPVSFITNLRSLEFFSSPRKRNAPSRHHFHYHLKMSTLCEFLALTPLLEELVLANTVPYFDITLPSDGAATGSADSALIVTHPIKLDHLRSVDWTYPSTIDIHRFFSMIDAPELEKLDLWVEEPRAKRHDPLTTYPAAPPQNGYTPSVLSYPSLRDLSLQCAGEETTASVLRKFLVPALQKVEFTNFDVAARRAQDARSHLPTFPRLESVFRDPRLLNLTHLTLSHYTISSEPGRVEALLGYMPVLTSLSLDACAGLGRLLEGLQETVGGTSKGGGVGARSRRGVKVCPRLDTLSFWDCQDVDCASLRAVILSRNRSVCGFDEDCTHPAEPLPTGAAETVTRRALDGAEGGGQKTKEDPIGRKIKPLRKQRRHRPDLGASTDADGDLPSTIASTIIAMEEAFQPAHISFLRVHNCTLMGKEEFLAFRDLGVVDVIWAGSG